MRKLIILALLSTGCAHDVVTEIPAAPVLTAEIIPKKKVCPKDSSIEDFDEFEHRQFERSVIEGCDE